MQSRYNLVDYHLHFWPHDQRDFYLTLDHIKAYCDKAAAQGVTELALTEHLFRFKQADFKLGKWWELTDDPGTLKSSMAKYWYFHVGADLDRYVEIAKGAQREGLPVVVGLEVDFYPGLIDSVRDLISSYPFDVVLGSVHWIGSWRFDDLFDKGSMQEWEIRDIEKAWHEYVFLLRELGASKIPDILAHPDLIKVANKIPDKAFRDEIENSIVEIFKENNLVAEFSSAGLRKPVNETYPSPNLLRKLVSEGVCFSLASDAHNLNQVADNSLLLGETLEKLGVNKLATFKNRQRSYLNLIK